MLEAAALVVLLSSPSPTPGGTRVTAVTGKDARRAAWRAQPRFLVWLGPRGAVRWGRGTAGGGGAGALGVAVRIVHGFGVFVDLAEGVYARPGQVIGEIRLGVRYAFGLGVFQPAFLLGVDHGHEQAFAGFADEPGRTLVGSSDTIDHRTGPMAGLELRAWLSPDPARKVLHHMAVVGRLDATYYVDDAPLGWRLALGVAFAAVF